MKNQGIVTPPHLHNISTTQSKDNKVGDIWGRELRSLLLKMINDFKEDSNKQTNEFKESIQDLHKKVNIMDGKFIK
jgi:hypothetical protein